MVLKLLSTAIADITLALVRMLLLRKTAQCSTLARLHWRYSNLDTQLVILHRQRPGGPQLVTHPATGTAAETATTRLATVPGIPLFANYGLAGSVRLIT